MREWLLLGVLVIGAILGVWLLFFKSLAALYELWVSGQEFEKLKREAATRRMQRPSELMEKKKRAPIPEDESDGPVIPQGLLDSLSDDQADPRLVPQKVEPKPDEEPIAEATPAETQPAAEAPAEPAVPEPTPEPKPAPPPEPPAPQATPKPTEPRPEATQPEPPSPPSEPPSEPPSTTTTTATPASFPLPPLGGGPSSGSGSPDDPSKKPPESDG